ncbi:MAG: hypothetical protein K0R18_145 [Bacillales bacterium]|jgi:hypothetical protein|nr:hypothetical protein [Bacillales bacterium]
MDLLMNYEEACELIRNNGWDDFLALLNEKFPKYNLKGCSMSWYEEKDGSKFICKAKGSRGDVIVGWYGVHDKAM